MIRRWRRKILLACSALLLLALIFVAFIPTILGSDWARGRIARWLSDEAGVELRIGRLDLAWGGPQELGDVSARLPDGEFAGDELARLGEIRLDASLWALIAGPDSIRATARGLHVMVDERGNGRTSLDALLRRYFPPQRPGAVVVVKPAPDLPKAARKRPALPDIALTLTDCSVRLRRFPYQTPTRRIDVFKEDVPVRALDAAPDIYAISTAHVSLRHRDSDLHVTVDGGLAHGEDRMPFSADITIANGVPHGTVEIDSFDLAILEPFVPGPLQGRFWIKASGSLRDGHVEATIDTGVHDLVTAHVSEKSIHASVRLVQDDKGFGIRDLMVESASGRFAVDGELDLPKHELQRASGHLRGKFPLAVATVVFAHKRPPATAQVRFDLTSRMHESKGHTTGTIHLDHFTMREQIGEVVISFDASGDRNKRLLQIHKFELQTPQLEAQVSGTIHHGTRWTADFSGSASGDLDRVHHIASHFSHAVANTKVSGACTFTLHALQRSADGALDLTCAVRATDLSVQGDGVNLHREPEVVAAFDGSLADAGSTLVVRKAQLQELELSGRASGLRLHGVQPTADGRLRGRLPFNAMLLRLIAADDIEQPRGTLDVDLVLGLRDGAARAHGKLGATDLHFRAGDYIHDDSRVDARVDAKWNDGHLTGALELKGTTVSANLRDIAFDPALPRVVAKGNVRVPDPAPLRRLLLDEGWTWSGEHNIDDAALTYAPGSLLIEGTIHAPALRFSKDGHGINGEAATVHVRARETKGRWEFDGSRIALPERDLHVTVKRFTINPDGSITGECSARAPLESLHDHVALLSIHGVHGAAEATVEANHTPGQPWIMDATLRSPNIGVGYKSYGALAIRAERARLGSTIDVPRITLTIPDTARVDCSFKLDDRLRAKVECKGTELFDILRLVPRLRGGGNYDIKASLDMPRPGVNGPVTVECTAGIDRLEIEGVAIGGLKVRLAPSSLELRSDGIYNATIKAQLDAATVRQGSVIATDVHFDHRGHGAEGDYTINLIGKVRKLQVDTRTLERLTLTGAGKLHGFNFAAHRAIRFNGTLGFQRIPGAALEWRDGKANFSWANEVLEVTNLRAAVRGGTLTASGSLDTRGVKPIWSLSMDGENAQMDKGFADPLSFIIPILRVGDGGNAQVSGFASWKVRLRGHGFAFKDLERHLQGGGNLRIHEATVRGSLLLPLLSLRVGRLLLNKPFEIPDSTVNWKVAGGVVTTDPINISGRPFPIRMGGSVTLAGDLDYVFHPGILIVPLRVSGPWGNIKVRPTTKDLLPKWPWSK